MKIEPCELAEDLMPAAAEGALSEESRVFLEEHMKECGKCRKLYEDYLAQRGEEEPPPSDAVYKKLRWRMILLPLLGTIGGWTAFLALLYYLLSNGIL